MAADCCCTFEQIERLEFDQDFAFGHALALFHVHDRHAAPDARAQSYFVRLEKTADLVRLGTILAVDDRGHQ